MTGHIWWLGLKYVTSQRTFCGLYVGILTSSPMGPIFHLFEFGLTLDIIDSCWALLSCVGESR